MIVPYGNLKAQYASLREEILAALDGVGSKAAFILGEEVQEFEREFADYCGAKHCVAVNPEPVRCTWRCWRWAWEPAMRSLPRRTVLSPQRK